MATSLVATSPVLLSASRAGICRAARAEQRWVVHEVHAGERVRCLAAGTAGAGVAYAGTDRGVRRSSDGGVSWTQSGLDDVVVTAIAVAPSDPSTVYAGTKPARLFVSTDGGERWRELRAFRRIRGRWFWRSPAERPYAAYVQGLAVAPNDPRVVLAGIEAGAVVRTSDGGISWSGHRRRATRDCHGLLFHARDARWAYEAGGLGAAVSRDGGRSWARPRAGLDRRYCWAVAADPERPDVWYVSAAPGPFRAHGERDARAGIFRSVGGGPWEPLAGGLAQPLGSMPYGLAAPRPGELYAVLADGEAWHSDDGGDTWARLPITLDRNQRAFALLG